MKELEMECFSDYNTTTRVMFLLNYERDLIFNFGAHHTSIDTYNTRRGVLNKIEKDTVVMRLKILIGLELKNQRKGPKINNASVGPLEFLSIKMII